MNAMMLDQAAAILGYRFGNEAILAEALTHASSADHRLKSNERMEFLGDAILGYVMSEHLYQNYPQMLEGDLTKIKSAVVSRKTCAQASQKLNLCSLLSLGKGMNSRSELPGSVAAGVFESIIAAIYLDGGIEPVKRFIIEQLTPFIEEIASSNHQQNFKSYLQQHVQKQHNVSPCYVLLDEKGPDHSKCFEVCVEVDGQRYPAAWANSKKEAEQRAALQALKAMGLAQVDEQGRTMIPSSPL